ncbi:ABC transporter ATP-binding protein [Oceaniserpentilla sp. 4NH20-0058]|uniref:ABC transporter ATP-binding protein n=1 Tax=Oceaniserpentilla sp. 4NH20-0058 TaxID=3127660 RepID=UPI003107FEE9
MSSPALNIEDLSVYLQGKIILKDFTLCLNQGEILCLLGPSGCGKTTALKALAGLLEAKHGTIHLFDQVLKHNRFELPPEQRDIGFIFQDYALFPHMSVADNIGFSLKSLNKEARNTTIQQNLDLVNLSHLGERFPHELSGGQQQRTAVARALAKRPKLLLMDEPFSNIDSQIKYKLMAELREILKQSQITCIFVTHSKQEAFHFADKTAILNNGKIEQVDNTQVIFERPKNTFVAQFMEAGNLIESKHIPAALFLQPIKNEASDDWLLLQENGFKLVDESVGVKGLVIDSVYIGHRYRNHIQCDGFKLWLETLQALNTDEHINIQYQLTPLVLANNA